MTVITRQDILSHQQNVPWTNLLQVEQDLLLSLSMLALFQDSFLGEHVAMRGGTILHKVHLPPPARYSEDIDLVVISDRDENHIRAAVKRVLRSVLGRHKSFSWQSVRLALRNATQPSRILRVDYEVPSIGQPGQTLKIKIEANVSERRPYLPTLRVPFAVALSGRQSDADLISYNINEMLGTKLRALFQRNQGRDLFDLYWALSAPQAGVDPDMAIEAFVHYMAEENKIVRRKDFLEAFEQRLRDPGFRSDMAQLLRSGLHYDVDEAGGVVKQHLLNRLPL